MKTAYSNNDLKVLDFIALRLLNYSRINYSYLLEAIEGKFSVSNADILVQEAFLASNMAEISRDHISLVNRDTLEKFHTELN